MCQTKNGKNRNVRSILIKITSEIEASRPSVLNSAAASDIKAALGKPCRQNFKVNIKRRRVVRAQIVLTLANIMRSLSEDLSQKEKAEALEIERDLMDCMAN